MEKTKEILQNTISALFSENLSIELTRPDPKFGDYATNVALQLSKKIGKNPREIAEQIVGALPKDSDIVAAEIAGPGFINLRLNDQALMNLAKADPEKALAGKVVVAEYSDPNPFKVLHAGHLYTSVVGDAIANLLETAGANVHRVNFGGDVGLHVGKTMWAILKQLGGQNPEKLTEVENHAEWMAQAYVEGTAAYEDDEQAKQEIVALNKKVYQLHATNDKVSPFAQIYWTTRQWSYDYFDEFYARIGTKFEKYYPESGVAELGKQVVKQHTGKVFEESDGAVVFKGEPFGLHTRVFINREGLPTYEAKDVGLIFTKKQEYNFDKSVVITGNEQEQYMAVVLKAIEQFEPDIVKATSHLTHGLVKLAGGVKMSSRKGNILKAVDILQAAEDAVAKISTQKDDSVALAAIKYSFLKQRTGGDVIYDPEESVSLQGNSGPYLQYAHARACSILNKANTPQKIPDALQAGERELALKLGEYTEVINRAIDELMPHHVCTYLYELAQVFNRFYENNRVVGDEREAERLELVSIYKNTLQEGLSILGITAPESM